MRRLLTLLLWKEQRLCLRVRGLMVRFLVRLMGGTCGRGLLVASGFHFKYPPHRGIQIGNNCSFGKNITLDVPAGGELLIGDRCSFTLNIVLAAVQRIEIGADTQVAEFTSVRDADHGIELGKIIKEQAQTSLPIYIGSDVWLARGVVVLKGAHIGNGAVIGANAVVKGIIETNAIAVGAPAKVIRSRCVSSR